MWEENEIPVYQIGDTLIMGNRVDVISFDEEKEELSFLISGRNAPLVFSTKGISAETVRSEFFEQNKKGSSWR